jgi:hypothetical protein
MACDGTYVGTNTTAGDKVEFGRIATPRMTPAWLVQMQRALSSAARKPFAPGWGVSLTECARIPAGHAFARANSGCVCRTGSEGSWWAPLFRTREVDEAVLVVDASGALRSDRMKEGKYRLIVMWLKKSE